MSSSEKRGEASSSDGELIRLRAGDGSEHFVSRASLLACGYFRVKLGRWKSGVIELDVDDASLRIVLTLLRYGAGAVPSLDAPLRAMVLKDADYLGVPGNLWYHLAEEANSASAEARCLRIVEWEHKSDLSAAHMTDCGQCQQRGCRHSLRCVSCDALAAEGGTYPASREPSPNISRLHECGTCGSIEYLRKVVVCVVCGWSSGGRRT